MYQKYLLLLLVFFPCVVLGQTVITSAGQTVLDEQVQLSWTIGEPVIAIQQNEGVFLTQGFQQGEIESDCRIRDSLALADLYIATGGENWTYTALTYFDGEAEVSIPNAGSLWDVNTPIDTWHGVEINEEGCVVNLLLNQNGLAGSLIDVNLQNLERLYLYDNQLIGAIPNFSNLVNLRYFRCYNNQLSNAIPDFSNLPALISFSTSFNQLTGTIPNFSNLPSLQSLSIHNNELVGEIPNFSDLARLKFFRCYNNQLTGTIPSFASIASLIEFRCQFNNLTGVIPDFDNFNTLEIFNISNNNLSGCFPSYVCDLDVFDAIENPELPWQGDFQYFCNGEEQIGAPCDDSNENTELDQIQEDCTCGMPIVVNECRMRDSLALVALYNATDGENWTEVWDLNMPMEEWFGVTFNEEGCVIHLELSNNQLNGEISTELENLTNLTQLDLSVNRLLSGSIPIELGDLMNLTVLNLSYNSLSRSIPVELGSLMDLTELRLDNNELSGSIPLELSNLMNLRKLVLWDNQLSSSIPLELGNLTNLTVLALGENKLSGSIPVELGRLNKLISLNLYKNELSGEIPVELGDLINLTGLNLSFNRLSGSIPRELGDLINLTQLDLRVNELSDSIPSELGNLAILETLDLGGNELSGSIPLELGNLTNLTSLYLNSNQLKGCFDGLERFCLLNSNTDYDGFYIDRGDTIYYYNRFGYNLTKNPQLPWQGDFQPFCNGEEQIGTPCNDGNENTELDQIQADCSCVGIEIEDCQSVTITADTSLCTGETLFWDNRSISSTGEYMAIFPIAGDCDSTVNLMVTFVETKEEVREVQSCDIDEVGTDTLLVTQSVAGCDSLLLLEVSFSPTGSSVISRTICEGEEVLVNGKRYYRAGVFEDIIPNSEGCDSLVIIAISELQPSIRTQEDEFCTGESYYFAGQYLTREGLYKDTLRSVSGCDSLITFLDLNEVNISNFQAIQDEVVMINSSRSINIYPLENDILAADETYILELLDAAMHGSAGVNGQELNYQLSDISFIGDEVLRYVVCAEACPSSCDTASVYIQIYPDCLEGIEERLPSGIIQDVMNANACFDPLAELAPFCTAPILEAELMIINTNSQIVFVTRPYEAWCGKDSKGNNLPAGTYYYVFRFRLGEEEVILKHWIVLFNEG